jgi:hypothetical protein
MLLSKENQAAKPFNRKHVGFSAPILQVPAPSLQRKIIAFILISGEKRKPSSEHRSSTVTYGRGGGDRKHYRTEFQGVRRNAGER